MKRIILILLLALAGCAVKEAEVSRPQIFKPIKQFGENLVVIWRLVKQALKEARWDDLVKYVDKLLKKIINQTKKLDARVKSFHDRINSDEIKDLIESDLTNANFLIGNKAILASLDKQYEDILSDLKYVSKELDELNKSIKEAEIPDTETARDLLSKKQTKIAKQIDFMEDMEIELKLARVALIDKMRIPVLRQDIAATKEFLNEGDIIAAKKLSEEIDEAFKKEEDFLDKVIKKLQKDEHVVNVGDKLKNLKNIGEGENFHKIIANIEEAESKLKIHVAKALDKEVPDINFTDDIYETLMFRSDFIHAGGHINSKLSQIKIDTMRVSLRKIIQAIKERNRSVDDIKGDFELVEIKNTIDGEEFIKKIEIENLSVGKIKEQLKNVEINTDNETISGEEFIKEIENLSVGEIKEQLKNVELIKTKAAFVFGGGDRDLFKIVANSEGSDFTDSFLIDNFNEVKDYRPGESSYIVAQAKPGKGSPYRVYVCITSSKIIFHSMALVKQSAEAQTTYINEVNDYCAAEAA